MIDKNFEKDLINGIEPIRFFALATSIFHLFDQKIHAFLSDETKTIAEVASALNLNYERLDGFFSYLANENIIKRDGVDISLTAKGQSLAQFKAWYIMMIGGYGETFMGMGGHLVNDTPPVSRDIVHVGVGSCGISEYDAFPLTKKLINSMSIEPKTICDLGCGNGMYLIEFSNFFPGIKAVGVEPNEESCIEARAHIKAHGADKDVSIVCNDSISFVKENSEHEVDLYILGFVLHEILGQAGEAAVIDFLKTIRMQKQNTYLAVIEVDDQINDEKVMKHGLSMNYYNPYYLLHYFTNQKLETDAFWLKVFQEAGYDLIKKEDTLDRVDSTGLEIGYLLKPIQYI